MWLTLELYKDPPAPAPLHPPTAPVQRINPEPHALRTCSAIVPHPSPMQRAFKLNMKGWGYSSVGEYLPGTHKALGFVPSPAETKQSSDEYVNLKNFYCLGMFYEVYFHTHFHSTPFTRKLLYIISEFSINIWDREESVTLCATRCDTWAGLWFSGRALASQV